MDTIFALASGRLPAAVAIVRISGPQTRDIVWNLTGRDLVPRVATFCGLVDKGTGLLIDQGLVIWFPGPFSYTGEDCAEFQVHGSRAILAALFKVLRKRDGCRSAERGEFTKRAFLNGKMDLTAAEALTDLIDSETELQRFQALNGLIGGLSSKVQGWRSTLVELRATVEVCLDFPDEGEVPTALPTKFWVALENLKADLLEALGTAQQGCRIRDGYSVLIMGPPNAGKSSLLNALARRDVAIVSEHAGTTRDLLEVELDLSGLPVVLIDSAGLRQAVDPVEMLGIDRGKRRAAEADLILWLSSVGSQDCLPEEFVGVRHICVGTKSDLISPKCRSDHGSGVLPISTLTGAGIDELLAEMHRQLYSIDSHTEPAVITRERHRWILETAIGFMHNAVIQASDVELLAEELRSTSRCIESLVGGIQVEDILDEIFGNFCIGK